MSSSYAAVTTASQKSVAWSSGLEMLNIYLPRVSNNINTEELQYFLREIAKIEYVDFVGIKDQDSKVIRYYAAYIKLKEWNSLNPAYEEMRLNKSFKLVISPVEFLILLPNKTPMPRTKVNIHQLASFTEELFNRVAALESHSAVQAGIINCQTQQINQQTEQLTQQAHHINWLMKMMTFKKKEEEDDEEEDNDEEIDVVKRITYEEKPYLRSKKSGTIYNMEQDVVGKWNEETNKIDFDVEFACVNCKRKFDDAKQLGFHETVCIEDGEDVEDYSSNEKCIQRLKRFQEEEKEKTQEIKVPWQLGSHGICGNL
jgi:hypothetical protein